MAGWLHGGGGEFVPAVSHEVQGLAPGYHVANTSVGWGSKSAIESVVSLNRLADGSLTVSAERAGSELFEVAADASPQAMTFRAAMRDVSVRGQRPAALGELSLKDPGQEVMSLTSHPLTFFGLYGHDGAPSGLEHAIEAAKDVIAAHAA